MLLSFSFLLNVIIIVNTNKIMTWRYKDVGIVIIWWCNGIPIAWCCRGELPHVWIHENSVIFFYKLLRKYQIFNDTFKYYYIYTFIVEIYKS